jgi:hypothetical protein
MKRKINNHALQASTTTPTVQMQARIHQLKLGVDWHVDHFRIDASAVMLSCKPLLKSEFPL